MKKIIQTQCQYHGHTNFYETEEGFRCVRCFLPADYEPCGDCGFDHAYEYEQANKFHRGKVKIECLNHNIGQDVDGSCSECGAKDE